VVGSLMKMMGSFLGKKPTPEALPRGFLGIELADDKDGPVIRSVLAAGPAARAGVKVGDRVSRFQGRTVVDADDVYRFAGRLGAGMPVKLTVVRDGKATEIGFQTGEGL
jgi:S1-C subfamily serine protease